jgi:hypothetical protein
MHGGYPCRQFSSLRNHDSDRTRLEILPVSTVSTVATLVSSIAACVIMTVYIEHRLVPLKRERKDIQRILTEAAKFNENE